jgi:N utilization substance protein A
MSVRAYKIAEELCIERNEFVEKAKAFGVELRNAMATLDEEQIALLRDKLAMKTSDFVTEARVERKGQNVRLAVQLTGWKIDIKSESKMRELARWFADACSAVPGCGESESDMLLQSGVTSLDDLARGTDELLTSLPGVDEAGAEAIRRRAGELETERVAAEARAAAEAAAAAAANAETGTRSDGER